MNVIPHYTVLEFLDKLDDQEASDVFRLIEMLRERGHTLGMPLSKPVGRGLHELRTQGKPAFRVLYGFHNGEAILLLAMKKQKPELNPRDIKMALNRFHVHCSL
ncbi:MAG: type II toxin-antitoxin system RelE/ParE family toxin [Candidatus Paceibacterota bacterium]|jgi:hypothetical protein